jgi:hypothetical protein
MVVARVWVMLEFTPQRGKRTILPAWFAVPKRGNGNSRMDCLKRQEKNPAVSQLKSGFFRSNASG